eukprot:3431178-Rhodomonas_salina.1
MSGSEIAYAGGAGGRAGEGGASEHPCDPHPGPRRNQTGLHAICVPFVPGTRSYVFDWLIEGDSTEVGAGCGTGIAYGCRALCGTDIAYGHIGSPHVPAS